MGTKQILGLIGAIVLFVAVFTPVLSIPIMGNITFFQHGNGEGTIVLVLALASFILVLAKKYTVLWFTGLAGMAVIALTFARFQMKMSDAKEKMGIHLAGNPFKGLADMAMQSVQLQWGWALLVVGAALLIASAAIKEEPQDD
jgi:hypothetical protein